PPGTPLHPMQAAFREHHALQCGYCTSGMVMIALDIARRFGEPDEATIREQLKGNICRCTGYHNIVKAIAAGARAMAAKPAVGAIMRDFAYHRPSSLDEARQLALEEGAMLLAGGQTLLRDMKRSGHAPASLIDITGVVPKHIELHEGATSIGAGATHAEVA